MTTYTVNAPREITETCARSILETAGQGIGYWANDYRGRGFIYPEKTAGESWPMPSEFRIGNPTTGAESDIKPKRRIVRPADIAAALQWLVNACDDSSIPDHAKAPRDYVSKMLDYCEPDGFDGDAGDADNILQVAVFGRIIYG